MGTGDYTFALHWDPKVSTPDIIDTRIDMVERILNDNHTCLK